jgi:hypothetical protein
MYPSHKGTGEKRRKICEKTVNSAQKKKCHGRDKQPEPCRGAVLTIREKQKTKLSKSKKNEENQRFKEIIYR